MIGDIGCPSCDGDYHEMLDSDDNGTEFFALCVRCGVTFDSPFERRRAAVEEANRIRQVLNEVDDTLADDGVVKTVLRQRIRQELRRAEGFE